MLCRRVFVAILTTVLLCAPVGFSELPASIAADECQGSGSSTSQSELLACFGALAAQVRQPFDGCGTRLQACRVMTDSRLDGSLAHRAYGPGKEYNFYIDLAAEIAKAKASVFIIDAYIDEDLFNLYVSKIPATARTRVLSMKFDDNVEKVASMFSSQQPVQLRKTKHIHDRHVFIDNRGWAVGQSIKEAGKNKPTYLIELSEPTLSAARAAYEGLWNNATVLI